MVEQLGTQDMYCPRALLKLPRSGRTFFFALRTALQHNHFQHCCNIDVWLVTRLVLHSFYVPWRLQPVVPYCIIFV